MAFKMRGNPFKQAEEWDTDKYGRLKLKRKTSMSEKERRFASDAEAMRECLKKGGTWDPKTKTCKIKETKK